MLVRTHGGPDVSTEFPVAVSPHQPAFDIAGLAWQSNGVSVDLAFHGDVFEMEDQRNWSDASYKTYSTSLEKPFPVLVRAGEHLTQSITVTCSGEPVESVASPLTRLVETDSPMPELTLGAATIPGTIPTLDFGPRARLVELDTRTATWQTALSRAASEVSGGPLDVRIIATHADAVSPVLDALGGLLVRRLGVYDGQPTSRSRHCGEPWSTGWPLAGSRRNSSAARAATTPNSTARVIGSRRTFAP